MAGDWIKVEHATPDKPEVYSMATILGIDPDAVVGKLIRFWAWCDQQSISGNALTVTESVLDRITHQPGFSDALRKVAWLEVRSGSLQVPRFDRHNGQTSKARAVCNRRVAEHRDKCNATSVTNVTPQALEKPLPEKRREEKSITTSSNEEVGADRKKTYLLDEEFWAEMRRHYPNVDVDAESRKMDAWLLARPGRKKTRQFVINWLNKVEPALAPAKAKEVDLTW
jgi:hypothetical protein